MHAIFEGAQAWWQSWCQHDGMDFGMESADLYKGLRMWTNVWMLHVSYSAHNSCSYIWDNLGRHLPVGLPKIESEMRSGKGLTYRVN